MEDEEIYENEVSINIMIDSNEKAVFIGEENSSGCQISYNTLDELYDAFLYYIENYVKDRIRIDSQQNKNIIKLTDEEMIRYYANKIIEDGLTYCRGLNSCISMDEYDCKNFIQKHQAQILDQIQKDERVSDASIDNENLTFDMCFWQDYCPYYYEDNNLSLEEEINFLKMFVEKWLQPIERYIVPNNTIRNIIRNFMDRYIEINNEIDFDTKDDIYYCIKEHLCNTGFIDQYIDRYEVYIDSNNISKLIKSLEQEIKRLSEKIEVEGEEI